MESILTDSIDYTHEVGTDLAGFVYSIDFKNYKSTSFTIETGLC